MSSTGVNFLWWLSHFLSWIRIKKEFEGYIERGYSKLDHTPLAYFDGTACKQARLLGRGAREKWFRFWRRLDST
jgi:hypothetical protein